MAPAIRPRRSALYMPGSNPRALAKGRVLDADMLILDLEDAVAPDDKGTARAHIREALAQRGYGPREILIRVNALSTPWGAEDIAAMAGAGADGLLLPKVDGPADVAEAAQAMDAAGAPAGLSIWCMLETPRGILNAAAIAGSHPRLAGLAMGTADLGKALRARHTPDRHAFQLALQACVLAARANGLAALDGVHQDLTDTAGFLESCRQGRELGFDGKTLIHPGSIPVANAVFGPSEEEVAEARAIIAAFTQARRENTGVAVLNGRLVERLHVEEAEAVLALADAIAARAGG